MYKRQYLPNDWRPLWKLTLMIRKFICRFLLQTQGYSRGSTHNDLRNIAARRSSNSLLVILGKTKLLLSGTLQMLKGEQDFQVTFLDKQLQVVSNVSYRYAAL